MPDDAAVAPVGAELARLAGRRFRTRLTADDPVVRDHLVHDVPVLPGVFLLDLVLRLAVRSGIDPERVELRRCLFYSPVVAVADQVRDIEIEVGQPEPDGTAAPVTVRSRRADDGDAAPWQDNCSALLRLGPPWQPSPVDRAALGSAASQTVDADDLYAFVRSIGIRHQGFMKAAGRVHVGDDFALAEMRLPADAAGYLGHFHAHPVVLDFATLVPLLLIDPARRDAADHAFIPISIASLRARGPIGAENLVYVPAGVQGGLDGEVLAADITVCDPHGRVVAAMTGFRAKRVRAAEQITRLAGEAPPVPAVVTVQAGESAEELVANVVAAALDRPASDVDPDRGFYDLGLTSVDLLAIAGRLEQALGCELYPTLLFEYPTVNALAGHLRDEGHGGRPAPPPAAAVPPAPLPAVAVSPVPPPAAGAEVEVELAVVGVAGRYPGARDLAAFWDVLREGRDLVTEIPPDRWTTDPADQPGARWGAFLDGVAEFDPLFFHLSPHQAELLDPHERLFLQTAWEAVEDAGHSPESLHTLTGGEVGVFAGVMWNDYQLHGLAQTSPGDTGAAGSWFSAVPNRVSYAFDFRGPSLAVDTACSSSLVALHLAGESIRRGECRAAIVGGVNLSLHPYKYRRLAALRLLASDGRCRLFGRDADGYVPGEGVGAVLIRPLADALASGDRVYALIRSSALRHSGRTSGFAVPSPEAQRAVVLDALDRAKVPVETITYVEAQASTTTLADRIELAALTDAFGRHTAARGFCAIGSAKPVIGHLEAAAGIAGLTKILLCLRHGELVGTPHTDDLDPDISFRDTPFTLARTGGPWSRPVDPATGAAAPRRAGLSAFGAGGTLVHLVVEEYPAALPSNLDSPPAVEVVPLSARTEGQLREQVVRLRDHLRADPDLRLFDLAYTLQSGRRSMEWRLALTATSVDELGAALDAVLAGDYRGASRGRVKRGVSAGPAVPADAGTAAPEAVAEAWVQGRPVTWPTRTGARRLGLPTYPFDRQRHWIARKGVPDVTDLPATDGTLFYRPIWPATAAVSGALAGSGPLVVLDDHAARADALRATGRRVIRVRQGDGFARTGPDEYAVSPSSVSDHEALRDALAGDRPAAILHLWHLNESGQQRSPDPWAGLLSCFPLCRAWAVGLPDVLPVVYAFAGDGEQPGHAALGGMARSVRLEQPHLALKTVHLQSPPPDPAAQAALLLAEAGAADDIEVRYRAGGRQVLAFAPTVPGADPRTRVPLARPGAAYLITGGSGGLGLHVARRMAATAGVGLVLFGRSPQGPRQDAALAELSAAGARVRYVSGDVANPADVDRAVAAAARLGPLTGVIHSAGILDDALMMNKTPDRFRRVLVPKIDGVRCLDHATRDADLDYLVLFSSAAAVMGSVGATDYASGNRYLDAFAAWREERRRAGERRGRTLAVDWPVWRDGGMRIDPAVADQVLSRAGMRMLETADGLAALEVALAQPAHQLVVLRGDRTRLERRMRVVSEVVPKETTVDEPRPPASVAHRERELVALFADVLKVPEEELDVDDDLADYGVDSVTATQAVELLERRYNTPLVPSIIAQHRTIRALASHLDGVLAGPQTPQPSPTPAPTPAPVRASGGRVAVVAVAGRYPGAPTVEAFWDNLVHARDTVTETPPGRWPDEWLNRLDGEAHLARWGGFLPDTGDQDRYGDVVSELDGGTWLDPQQRLCLRLAAELVDRAGYRRAELAGRRISVYLGLTPTDMAKSGFLAGNPPTDSLVAGALPNMAAAAIAHLLDLRGPAEVVDTACSSSLVAIHQAARAVLTGECEMAIAGGCELLLDPFSHIGLGRAGLLTKDGRTRVFDQDAAGFALGEGAGLVLLKAEEQALRDGDQILAVILGSATNNDGRTLGLTAPSHEAQVDLIRSALDTAGVPADTIGYLEVNGSASGFGDPIEIHAAAEAYGRDSDRRQFCGTGSVKSNVGALLHAGGVAALTKVVLALRHGFLPATLHCAQPHPRLRFEATPFYPVTEGRDWPRPSGTPRRAAVSSFGFGGTNCHVVVEEAPVGHRPRRTPRPVAEERESPAPSPPSATADAVDRYLRAAVAELAGLADPAAAGDGTFMELGLTSAALVSLADRVERDLGVTVIPSAFFRYPDVRTLARHLATENPEPLHRRTPDAPRDTGDDIAVIGMAGMFPGAGDVDQFWARLAAGDDLVTEVPGGRWDHRRYFDPEGRPGTTDCAHGAFLDDVSTFDAGFFGVPDDEARGMDPQLRLLLQVLYAAAEDAGVVPVLRGSATGVFVGQCFRDYDDEMIVRGRPLGVYDPTGVAVSMTANRPSHFLDLSGPSLIVDTACSSSLYALHLAVDALRRGECAMAFAAGTNLILSPRHYLRLSAIGALSATGRCHAFDARADGYVPGEAVAAVLLKPLRQALADGDPVHAVVKAVAVNHGGHASSITAPNPGRQAELLARAWTEAGIDPRTLTYLEAHGTGTKLGDPVEVDGLREAFARYTGDTRFCALGTAKAHLGHTEGAAGVTSLVKTILSMRNRVIPAMPGFAAPNPFCRVDDGPLYVNREPVRWTPAPGAPRRAGISSFGFGGAYAHVVLEEAPSRQDAPAVPGPWAFPFSATDLDRLRSVVARHRDRLTEGRYPRLDQAAATLQRGREAFAERLVVVADDATGLRVALEAFLAGDARRVYTPDPAPAVAQAAHRWVAGGEVTWPGSDRPVPRVSLPAYPFGGRRYWLDDGPTVDNQVDAAATAAAGVAAHATNAGYDGRRVSAGLDRFDDLCRRLLHRVLRSGFGEDIDALPDRLADPATYGRLAQAVRAALGRLSTVDGDEQPDRLAAAFRDLVADHPELDAYTQLVLACLPGLPDVLTGRMGALELYFADDRQALWSRVYRGNAIADHHNDLVARAVRGYGDARPGRPLRILEVGAGTGGTTDRVLDAVAGRADVEYVFTDVSAAFFPAAEREFAGRAPVRFAVLDLNADPERQGFRPGEIDVIVAANVVHAAELIPAALARLRWLLADGGLLVLSEVTNNRDHLTALIGMVPGWWAYRDPDVRLPDSPLLDVAGWRAALAGAGFEPVWAASSARDEREFDHAVLLGRATAPARLPVEQKAVARVFAPERSTPVAGDALMDFLKRTFAEFFRIPVSEVDERATFDRYGLDSLGAIQLARNLEGRFGKLPKVLLYECPTLNSLADYLRTNHPEASPEPAPAAEAPGESEADDPIAVVGMAGTFPGSPDLLAWWRHLCDGDDLVTEIPPERFDWRGVYGDPARQPGTVNSRWGAFMDGVDRFDAEFFGVSPLEAELMDPQQRLFLQTAWRAVEDSGHRPAELRGSRTGVFVGATSRDYGWHLVRTGRIREGHVVSGNGHCVIANRVSYQLDLRGPSEAVDTACSSSLTALHRAVRSLRAGECDAALVGGVHTFLTDDLFVALGQLGMLSPDGRCRTFDRAANGFVRGEGVVAVVLKPLSRARTDGDTVYALVRGSGVNHGGHVKSLTVPNPNAQAELVTAVYRAAGVDPRTVTYVEAHGTGTEVGDPIELRGLRKAFAELTGTPEDAPVTPWCAVGSAKSNMGHLEAAAGLTGFVKTVLAMRHGTLPASLHFEEPNPLLEIEESPFFVVAATQPWTPPPGVPRRAGVTSIGFGGTNGHVLLEEYAQPAPEPDEPGARRLVVLSARDPERLRAAAQALCDRLAAADEPLPTLRDLAYTLQVGRDAMPARLAAVVAGYDQLRAALTGYLAGREDAGVLLGQVGRSISEGPVPAPDDLDGWAGAWVAGTELPWERLYAGGPPPRRVSLPTYPFAPERHWAEPTDTQPVPDTEEWQGLLHALQQGSKSLEEVDRLLVLSNEDG